MKRKTLNAFQRFGALRLSDAAIDHEIEHEFFSELAAKLAAGARGDGVTFSPNEFAALLELVKQRRVKVDNSEIALHCRWLELEGEKVEHAVEMTMEEFGIKSPQTVYSARKKYLKYLKD
jgi:hypothetical protein